MRQSSKIGLAAKCGAFFAIATAGCHKEAQVPGIEGILTGHTISVQNESQSPYITQEAVLHGKSYFITNKASDYNKLEEKAQRKVGAFGAFPREKVVKCIKNGVVTFEPETENDDYIFVLQGEGDAPVMDVKLKQKIQKRENSQKTNNSECDVNDLTQDEMQFLIRTIKINEQEYYVPNVPDKDKSDANALPFVLMPKSQTYVRVSPDGTLVLRGPAYRAISAPRVAEYAKALAYVAPQPVAQIGTDSVTQKGILPSANSLQAQKSELESKLSGIDKSISDLKQAIADKTAEADAKMKEAGLKEAEASQIQTVVNGVPHDKNMKQRDGLTNQANFLKAQSRTAKEEAEKAQKELASKEAEKADLPKQLQQIGEQMRTEQEKEQKEAAQRLDEQIRANQKAEYDRKAREKVIRTVSGTLLD